MLIVALLMINLDCNVHSTPVSLMLVFILAALLVFVLAVDTISPVRAVGYLSQCIGTRAESAHQIIDSAEGSLQGINNVGYE